MQENELQGDDLLYTIAFSMLKNVSERQKLKILQHYGSATNIYQFQKSNQSNWPLHAAANEMQFMEKHAIGCFSILDKFYPNRLANIADPPLVLYVKGADHFNQPHLISIVGTRQHSYQVKKVIQELLEGLIHLKMGVISGMALGVDGIAHELAIENNIPTWGIMAHGLDTIYPNQHRRLAIKMLQNKGGLITECRQKTLSMPFQFPKRNRIVAGMSDITIVIESNVDGGSMITAKLARGYDREVFAVPGKIHDAKSKGCLWLIKNEIASIYFDPIHLLEQLNWPAQKRNQQDLKKNQPIAFVNLDPIEQSLFLLIQSKGPIHKDAIEMQLAISSSVLAGYLIQLELNGLIHLHAGNVYSCS
jgi:DNA processing protein